MRIYKGLTIAKTVNIIRLHRRPTALSVIKDKYCVSTRVVNKIIKEAYEGRYYDTI